MIVSISDLPDDILLELFSRYLSVKDLCRLEQVCRQFHTILHTYPVPWKKALGRVTNVSFSQLKNAAGCPSLEVRFNYLNILNYQKMIFSSRIFVLLLPLFLIHFIYQMIINMKFVWIVLLNFLNYFPKIIVDHQII